MQNANSSGMLEYKEREMTVLIPYRSTPETQYPPTSPLPFKGSHTALQRYMLLIQ